MCVLHVVLCIAGAIYHIQACRERATATGGFYLLPACMGTWGCALWIVVTKTSKTRTDPPNGRKGAPPPPPWGVYVCCILRRCACELRGLPQRSCSFSNTKCTDPMLFSWDLGLGGGGAAAPPLFPGRASSGPFPAAARLTATPRRSRAATAVPPEVT
jgi:hypothetical protein